MLTEKQINVCELIATGIPITEVSRESGVPRRTIYEWKKLDEFNAEVRRFAQEYVSAAEKRLNCAATIAADEMIKLLKNGKYEKTRLAAAQDILDRNLGKATTRVEVDDSRDNKEELDTDLLDKEMKEFENE